MSIICSGASHKNSQMMLMLETEKTMAVTMTKFSAILAIFWPSVWRCHIFSVTGCAVNNSLDVKDFFDIIRSQFSEQNNGNNGDEYGEDEVVLKALKGGKQGAANAPGAYNADHGGIAQV